MVAQKRGRGAKTPAKPKPTAAQPAEEQVEEVTSMDTTEAAERAAENNGESEQSAEQTEAMTTETGGETEKKEETKPEEEKKEEKVESGKILIENLPSSYLFNYQEKLKELFSKHGEVVGVKRGPIIVTELTTTPTLSAIVEFKNKESLEKALTEDGTVLDGSPITVAEESRADTTVLVGVPYEASTDYVRLLFAQCGEVAHIYEFSKTKYKILRVTFHEKEAVEKALKLDRELRINGFMVTVSKYRDEDEQKAHSANANKKRQHSQQQQQNRNSNANTNTSTNTNSSPANRNNSNFRSRGGSFDSRGGNYRGSRGRGGYGARGGGFPRGGFAPINSYGMPPHGYMARPSYL